MKKNNNISYRNSDSPESPLNVKYKYKEGTKTLEINKSYTPKNVFLPIINYNKSVNKANILRQQHFNSYSNENMDFFRLDYLKECDRNHHHNKHLSNIIPVNRNENYDKLNEDRKKIKYIDSLKKNFLLKKEKNKKDFFKDNLFTSENIINNNYYKKINNRYSNNTINLYNNKQINRYINKNDDNININNDKMYKNISIDEQKYSGAYLSNLNDYSIKENQSMNPYHPRNNKNLSKITDLRKQSHLFCKDVINNDVPALFYKIYDYNINKDGFKKQNNIFSNYAENSHKPGYIVRNIEPTKINLTPPKRNGPKNNYIFFSSKK